METSSPATQEPDFYLLMKKEWCRGTTSSNIRAILERIAKFAKMYNASETLDELRDLGRIGKTCVFVSSRVAGHMERHVEQNSVISKDNFSTGFANVGVFKGKWMYEITIMTKGIVQIGWALQSAQRAFTSTNGIGDTADSYSYDGYRKRGWNVLSHEYGELWQPGDVISCFIDMERREMSFSRNGCHLGIAFKDFSVGKDVAYCPAVSLSKHEVILHNFGDLPVLYPRHGFKPLQACPSSAVQFIKDVWRSLVNVITDEEFSSNKVMQWAIARQLISALMSVLLADSNETIHIAKYVMHDVIAPGLHDFVPEDFMTQSSMMRFPPPHHPSMEKLMRLMDLFHSILNRKQLIELIDSWIKYWSRCCMRTAETLEFTACKRALTMAGAVFAHSRTRVIAIKHLLLSKGSSSPLLGLFHCVVNKSMMEKAFTDVYWTTENVSMQDRSDEGYWTSVPTPRTTVTHGDKHQYEACLEKTTQMLEDVERLQAALLHQFLIIEAGASSSKPSSRELFLMNLRHVLIKSVVAIAKYPQAPFSLMLHPLLRCFSDLWSEEVKRDHLSVPDKIFFTDKLPFYETDRLGGSVSHLINQLKQVDRSNASIPAPPPLTSVNSRSDSLYILADCIVMYYHYCCHRYLVTLGMNREKLNSMLDKLAVITERCDRKDQHARVIEELQINASVLHKECTNKLLFQTWDRVKYFSHGKIQSLVKLLTLVLNTIIDAQKDHYSFEFIPEYYMAVFTELSFGLVESFHLPDYLVTEQHSELYKSIATFLCQNFCNPRIKFTDSREQMVQCLASFVTCKKTADVLHKLNDDVRHSMVKTLLQPYENKVWAQNNWILVKFWKGNGFAFRFYTSPHLTTKITPKPTYTDTGRQWIAPRPSEIFQNDVKQLLREDYHHGVTYVNALLTHLNWTFSEFIGMLQEIQNYSHRSERVFIDSRQLRICCTCFELAVALLRVLEMVVNHAPHIFITNEPANKNKSEVLLSMLCKLICHVLNRVSVGGQGCFSHVVSLEIPGMDTLHHFPIVSATVGILLALLKDDVKERNNPQHDPLVTKTLFDEPSFLLSTFRNLIGVGVEEKQSATQVNEAGAAVNFSREEEGADSMEVDELPEIPATTQVLNTSLKTNLKNFSLKDYPNDVSDEEYRALEECVHYLEEYDNKAQQLCPSDAYSDCVICCARRAVAQFNPCGHNSCRACVTQHLMARQDCFFCTKNIESVVDLCTGEIFIDKTTTESASVISNISVETSPTQQDAPLEAAVQRSLVQSEVLFDEPQPSSAAGRTLDDDMLRNERQDQQLR